MNIEQEYDSRTKKNHADLLRMVEKYLAPLCLCLAEYPSKYGKCTARMLLELKDRIDDCPLYAFDFSATCRSIELSNERIKAVVPPIPSRGCIIATAESAIFIAPIDDGKRVESDPECFLSVGASELSDFNTSKFELENKPVVLRINFNVVKSVNDTYHISIPLSIKLCSYGDEHIPSLLYILTYDGTKINQTDSYELINGMFEATRIPLLNKIDNRILEQCRSEQFEEVRDVLHDLLFTDLPIHYVVEERPAHIDEVRKKRAKAARFDDRERWIILDPEAVKKSMKNRTDLGGTHSSPSLHLRGAHNRELKHECFTKMRGTILRIRPTWIGDRSWGVKRTKYKVISRLGASKTQA